MDSECNGTDSKGVSFTSYQIQDLNKTKKIQGDKKRLELYYLVILKILKSPEKFYILKNNISLIRLVSDT